ncbi:GNAT family N-acetyltransferase [Pantoea sp. B623]|uniref:GNAT family N-acetyltransferase n=1 Tax=Pantoea sp. B623 TaxID=2974561 RepID=UPI0021671412|nr:GNAT family N-acetyltransferase [Pantoea sp. B623]MCS4492664.1 GNAT family N-acetyltransferase [Pantoea sp. B623]
MDRITHGRPEGASALEEMRFRENENAWLLTLPEIQTEGHLIPACKIVAVRTVGGDRYEDGLSCTLFLSCQYEGNTLDQTFAAVLRTYIRPDDSEYSFLDLTGGDFVIDSRLRGRGLGSWIMQQLVCWARTLPADMRVRRISLSVRDDADEENYLRRENFWRGLGFRFAENSDESFSLRIRDLRFPRGRRSSLAAVRLDLAVSELSRTCTQQQEELDYLKAKVARQAERICFLTERQWKERLVTGLWAGLFYLLNRADRLFERTKAGRTDGQPDDLKPSQRRHDNQD